MLRLKFVDLSVVNNFLKSLRVTKAKKRIFLELKLVISHYCYIISHDINVEAVNRSPNYIFMHQYCATHFQYIIKKSEVNGSFISLFSLPWFLDAGINENRQVRQVNEVVCTLMQGWWSWDLSKIEWSLRKTRDRLDESISADELVACGPVSSPNISL